MAYDGTGLASIKPVDLLVVGNPGEGKNYWEFTVGFPFSVRDERARLESEDSEAQHWIETMLADVAEGRIPQGNTSWVGQAELERLHEERLKREIKAEKQAQRDHEKWERQIAREKRKLDEWHRAEEERARRRDERQHLWREIAAGREVQKNVAKVFKQDPEKIAALDATQLEDYEKRREGIYYNPEPDANAINLKSPDVEEIALGLHRFKSDRSWIIDVESVDGWENFGIYALCEDQASLAYFCEISSTRVFAHRLVRSHAHS